MAMDSSNSTQARGRAVDSFGLSHQQYDPNGPLSMPQNSSREPFPYGLTRFYGINDGPWSHVAKTSVIQPGDPHANHQLQAMINYNPNTPAFQNFRNRQMPPSECDTAPDDSGYGGSRPPYSIENASQYEGESNPEAHNASNLMESLHLQGPIPNPPPSSWGQPPPTPSVTTAPPSAAYKFFCPNCDVWLRTKSEYNKHESRHNKPYHCEVPGCTRSKGFGTKNDLDRHKRSVHSDTSVSGYRYICQLETCRDQEPLKVWPRADNFRSHLRRIHNREVSPDDDLKEFIYNGNQRPAQDSGPNQPALREDLQGVGAMSYMIASPSTDMQKSTGTSYAQPLLDSSRAMAVDSSHGMPDINQDLNSLLQNSDSASAENTSSSLDSAQRPNQHLSQADAPTEIGQSSSQSRRPLNGQRMPLPDGRLQYSPEKQANVHDDCETFAGSDDVGPAEASTDSSEPGDVDGPRLGAIRSRPKPGAKTTDARHNHSLSKPEAPSMSEIMRLRRLESEDTILQYLKQLPKSILNRAITECDDDKSNSSQDSANQKNLHRCTQCTKSFSRQCELKKHLKRHEKPYGCTFPECSKSFGSKNDWKRHESSQHMQLETWKCEEMKSSQGEVCGKAFLRRESFRNHLNKEHGVTDTKQVDEKVDKCRIGRHCSTRFWCGFCCKVVDINEEGVNAWTIRCDHIDDHFCGRHGPKMNICKWVHVRDEESENESASAGSESSSQKSGSSSDLASTAGSSPSLKRRSGDDGHAGSHKKQRHERTLMWHCCNCNAFVNLKTTENCFDCSHKKCKHCPIDAATAPQDDQVEGS